MYFISRFDPTPATFLSLCKYLALLTFFCPLCLDRDFLFVLILSPFLHILSIVFPKSCFDVSQIDIVWLMTDFSLPGLELSTVTNSVVI